MSVLIEELPTDEKVRRPRKEKPIVPIATEQVKMGKVAIMLPEKAGDLTLLVPSKLLKTADQYREECGNIRYNKVISAAQSLAEEILLNAHAQAQSAYTESLESAFLRDEEFQMSLLEKEQKKSAIGE